MHRDYSVAVIIGRFQPLHNNHAKLVEQGLKIADKVLILVGSAYAARTPKNPFSFNERYDMFQATFPEMGAVLGDSSGTTVPKRIFVEPIRDYFYSDDVWLANVQAICSTYIEDGETVALLGGYKDSSSYYLNLFPQWEYVPPGVESMRVPSGSGTPWMDATAVRDVLFNVSYSKGWGDRGEIPKFTSGVLNKQHDFFEKNVPKPVMMFLQRFKHTTSFIALAEEYEDNAAYKKSWADSPFPPIFVTVDTVVTCAGHVLVVRRGGNPGKGLLALPGGFVRENERVRPAALRELKEETRIKVDKLILDSSIVDSDVFDYPGRSLRGRTITHAFHVKLRGSRTSHASHTGTLSSVLPEVKGGDDATGAFWLPMMEVVRRADEFFEDHIHIINRFISK